MKNRFSRVMLPCLLLLSLTLSACRDTDPAEESAASASPTGTAASMGGSATAESDPLATGETESASDSHESATQVAHPTTDTDGETNPDWPYSPAV